MNLQHGAAETVDTGLLVRHLHGELDAHAERALTSHLAGCESCRAVAASFQESMRRVSGTLRASDFEPPPAAEWRRVLDAARARAASPARARRLAVAAGWVLALLTAGALVTEPVRAWLAGQWASMTRADVTTPVSTTEATAQEQAGVSFVPGGSILEVTVRTTQQTGILSVRFDGEEMASVTVSDGGTERLAVGGGVLRIDNERSSSASYSLDVPTQVQRILVNIGGAGEVELKRADAYASPVTIDLKTGARVRTPPSRGDH